MKRKLTCINYFLILEKKDFQESTPKIQKLMLGLAQISHFGLWDIIPPESQLAFHKSYVKYENTLTCKRISWDSEGNDILKKYFSISYMYDTKSDHFSSKIKPYFYANRKSNAKSYMKMEAFDRL